MELFTYYNLTETVNADLILSKLEIYKRDYKIDYVYFENEEVFKIIDIELSDKEISTLLDIFDNNDIVPDFDFMENIDYDDLDMGNYDDEDNEYGYNY